MAKPNPTFQKRLREQKKREKREEKARRKAEREAAKRLGGGEGERSDDSPSDPADSEGS